MFTASQPLGTVVTTRGHGAPTSSFTFPTSTSAVVSSGRRAPRRRGRARRSSSRVSCSSTTTTTTTLTTEAANGAAPAVSGTVAFPAVNLMSLGEETITMKATVTVNTKPMMKGTKDSFWYKLSDLIRTEWLSLELLSAEHVKDPRTGQAWEGTVKHAKSSGHHVKDKSNGDFETFEASFEVPASFGTVGAVRVVNEHHHEVLLGDITVHYKDNAVRFHCNSWVHAKDDNPEDKRVFFPLQSYLPSQTPRGLEELRKSELQAIRGEFRRKEASEFKPFERVYDYDVYNDIGNPDESDELKRPVLGGQERPYPRRCRTGRDPSRKDASSEKRAESAIYVPRDEAFSEIKENTFNFENILSQVHAFASRIEKKNRHLSFPSLEAIDALYDPNFRNVANQSLWGELWATITHLTKFETPEIYSKDKLCWLQDSEFARETLAGMNPLSIQLVTEVPLVSKLDQATYGSQESLITKDLIQKQINGVMTVDEALENKRLFMLDYHDIFLPYVNKVRELDNTTLYASRTLFFLNKEDEMDHGTLRPIAIELTRPKSDKTSQWRKVFTPGMDGSATGFWLWQLAKTHVAAHDTGYHQLVSHWLRTHCCVEPYIIAANRQLSQMHPIYRLLHPYFRYTMEMNALGRSLLVNADGVIEKSFSPGKYCMELSSAVYKDFWRFDKEALPADLVRRGMAVEDEETGELKLAIPDYPYANDGLLVWEAIKKWASDYVSCYYQTAEDITGDVELKAWWDEVRTRGHEDKKDEPWWPELDGHDSLVQVLATIMWVTSGHHAAVNFGQYPIGGYFPNRPTTARRNVPPEGGADDMSAFMDNPEKVLLDTFPSQFQASVFLPVLDVLSSHSPDEEYLGTSAEQAWTADSKVAKKFEQFQMTMSKIVTTIDQRNADTRRKNRKGASVLKYDLLRPNTPGTDDDETVMRMGIPNSISI